MGRICINPLLVGCMESVAHYPQLGMIEISRNRSYFMFLNRYSLLMAIALILLWVAVVVAEKEQPLNLYSMELISSLPGTNVGGLTLFGRHLYFNEGWAGETTRVVDTANPAFPEIVGSTVGSSDLTFEGNYGYGLGWGGLQIYDVSDPAQPILLNIYYDFPSYQGETPGLLDVAVYQQTAYVSYYYFIDRCYEGSNLDVIDVSDPMNPVRVLTLGTVGGDGFWGDIEIIGHYAYILTEAVKIFDLTDPHQPEYVTGFGSAGTGLFPLTSKMTVFNQEMYVTTAQFSTPCFGVSEMWEVFNFSNPFDVIELATYLNEIIYIYKIADGYVYANFPGVGEQVISVVDHVNPVASFDPLYPFPFYPHGTAVIDGFIYIGHDEGLDVLRMSAVAEWVEPAVATTMVYTDRFGLAAQVAVGAGTVVSPTRLSYLPYPAVNDPPAGEVFVAAFDIVGYGNQFTLDQFERPVTVTLDYRETRRARAIIGEEAHLLRWTGTDWQEAAESCEQVSTYWRDPQQVTIRLAVCLPGKYVLVAPAGPLFLPALFR